MYNTCCLEMKLTYCVCENRIFKYLINIEQFVDISHIEKINRIKWQMKGEEKLLLFVNLAEREKAPRVLEREKFNTKFPLLTFECLFWLFSYSCRFYGFYKLNSSPEHWTLSGCVAGINKNIFERLKTDVMILKIPFKLLTSRRLVILDIFKLLVQLRFT